jgi:hypothetical protein
MAISQQRSPFPRDPFNASTVTRLQLVLQESGLSRKLNLKQQPEGDLSATELPSTILGRVIEHARKFVFSKNDGFPRGPISLSHLSFIVLAASNFGVSFYFKKIPFICVLNS